MNFAKLFGPDDDQILVKRDDNDESYPEVRVYFAPGGGFGVCSVAVSFAYNENIEGAEERAVAAADKCFSEITEEIARKMVRNTRSKLEGIPG